MRGLILSWKKKAHTLTHTRADYSSFSAPLLGLSCQFSRYSWHQRVARLNAELDSSAPGAWKPVDLGPFEQTTPEQACPPTHLPLASHVQTKLRPLQTASNYSTVGGASSPPPCRHFYRQPTRCPAGTMRAWSALLSFNFSLARLLTHIICSGLSHCAPLGNKQQAEKRLHGSVSTGGQDV